MGDTKKNKINSKFQVSGFLQVFLGIVSAIILIGVLTAEAKTTIYFSGTPGSAATYDFSVNVLVDSDEPLNAYDIEIAYPKDLVRVMNINESHSLVDFWQKKSFTDEGTILLSGGSITPFSGTKGEIAELKLSALKTGVAELAFRKAEALIADGKGTPAVVVAKSAPLSVYSLLLDQSGTEEAFGEEGILPSETTARDITPPRILSLLIEKNPLVQGELLLVFDARDEGSGMQSTLVRTREWLSWGNWQEAKNPYPFSRGVWSLELRATDNEGNTIERTVYRGGALSIKIGILLGISILFFVAYRVLRKRTQ